MLDKACFQHDMAYVDFEDLVRRTAFDKMLHDKTFNIAKNPKCDVYQRRIASVVYKLKKKKIQVEQLQISNKQLAEELHKQII